MPSTSKFQVNEGSGVQFCHSSRDLGIVSDIHLVTKGSNKTFCSRDTGHKYAQYNRFDLSNICKTCLVQGLEHSKIVLVTIWE